MTNADVDRVVKTAADRGITIDRFDAKIFLGAKQLAERGGPHAERALRVVQEYTQLIVKGRRPESFEYFLLPEAADFLTVEELEADRRSREAFRAAQQ